MTHKGNTTTLRIIPTSKCFFLAPIYEPWTGHLKGNQPYLGDLLTMVVESLTNWDDSPSRVVVSNHVSFSPRDLGEEMKPF